MAIPKLLAIAAVAIKENKRRLETLPGCGLEFLTVDLIGGGIVCIWAQKLD